MPFAIGRNRTERAYIGCVAAFRPDAVPRLLETGVDADYFCVEFLGGYANWEVEMLAGRMEPALAAKAGQLLGEIHRRSWGDAAARERFDTVESFDQLRIDPYLRATARKHPDLRDFLVIATGARDYAETLEITFDVRLPCRRGPDA